MDLFFLIFFFVLGAIVGSFLNVLVLRYNTGRTLLGRSTCFSCGKKLHWHELIPIVSYLLGRGRCISCNSKISVQYPLVEFFTAVLFAAAFIVAVNVYALVFILFILCLLVAIFVYDFRHKIIPNGFVYLFDILVFIAMWINFSSLVIQIPPWQVFWAGPLFFLFFFSLWFISRGRWMGLGDAKLSLGIGWFLGLTYGLTALIFAFWAGAIVGIILLALPYLSNLFQSTETKKKRLFFKGNRLTIKSEVPFAPFLIIGTLIVFFFNVNLFDFLEFIQLL